MSLNAKFSIGSDPEFMLANSSGEIVSAIPVIKVDKHNPIELGGGQKLYYDNVMLETNVPPANSKGQFLGNIKETYNRIFSVVGSGYRVFAVPSHNFKSDECAHPHAMEAGCSPEYCAYTRSKCLPPNFVDTFRSAGGHIHIGRTDFMDIDEDECDDNEFLMGFDAKHDMIRAMDIFVGLPLTVLDNSKASQDRKRLYGKAGRFRPTAYGVEYRTPSNFWLSSPKMAELIYDLTFAAWNTMKDGKLELGPVTDKAFTIINANDVNGANEMFRNYVGADLCEQIDALRGSIDATRLYKEWGIE
jgi:hypothetical protein